MDSVFPRAREAMRRFYEFQPGSYLVESLSQHRAILDAMKRRDAEEASRLMALHLEESEIYTFTRTTQGALSVERG